MIKCLGKNLSVKLDKQNVNRDNLKGPLEDQYHCGCTVVYNWQNLP